MSDDAIRNQYAQHGVETYYREQGASYRNPHEAIIRQCVALALSRWMLNPQHVLDLACGSGEVTLAIRDLHPESHIVGLDPFTGDAYRARTQNPALPYRFEEVAQGVLGEQRFDCIVCSFALHLLEASWLPALCYQLRQHAPTLLILTPHKRPELKPAWGWQLQQEFIHERVRTRFYQAR